MSSKPRNVTGFLFVTLKCCATFPNHRQLSDQSYIDDTRELGVVRTTSPPLVFLDRIRSCGIVFAGSPFGFIKGLVP